MSSRSSSPFPVNIAAELNSDRARARMYLESYFWPYDDPAEGFTGRFFEQFIGQSDPDRFTPYDLVAVSSLSVDIPPVAAAAILLDPTTSAMFNELLAQTPPPGVELASCTRGDIADDSPLSRLYEELRRLPKMGPTKTSKLLAAKRPALVPIRDDVVSNLLQADHRWWMPMRELALDPTLRDVIDDCSAGVVPDDVSFLRRLDVVLWQWGKHARITPTPDDESAG